MTLWVGGAMVSGVLTSASTYPRGLAEIVDAHPAGLHLADSLRSSAATLELENPDPELGYALIHLRDAKPWIAQESMSGDLVGWTGYWRGHLASVDGWTLGRSAEA